MTSLLPWGTNWLDAHKEFDQVFRRFFGQTPESNGSAVQVWAPRVDVSENEKEFTIEADLPGVDPKDLEITFEDGVLSLKGEKSASVEDRQKNYHRTERFYGTFYRTIPLPAGVDGEKIEAHSAKGVLTISIPKKPEALARKISVRAKD